MVEGITLTLTLIEDVHGQGHYQSRGDSRGHHAWLSRLGARGKETFSPIRAEGGGSLQPHACRGTT